MKTSFFHRFTTLTIVGILFPSSLALANSFTATAVVAKGDVKVLNSKIDKSAEIKKFVLFEGQKYSYKKIKIGMRLRPGQVVLTGTNGKAKLAYSNGDHMMVAPGTSVTIPAPVKGKKGTSSIKLIYGKMRALISKKGPRNKMNVRTKSAVAGVRGTDFFIGHNPKDGMEVVVLRGEVAVHNAPDKLATEVKEEALDVVKTGYHAKVKTKQKVNQVEASKEKLLDVQASSHASLNKKELDALPEKQKVTVLKLEKKASKAVLEDIKVHDPEQYKALKSKKLQSHNIHTEVISKLYKQAPRPKKPKKANLETIDQIGEDVYKKYFKED